MSLVATVFDHQLTHLQWRHEGQDYQAWSNVDFNYLTGFTGFRRGEKRFVNLMPVRNRSLADLPEDIDAVLDLLTVDGPAFLPVQDDFSTYEAYEAVDALHELYLVEGPRLIEAYEQREQNRLQREAEAVAAPPRPKDITLQLWKVEPVREGEVAE